MFPHHSLDLTHGETVEVSFQRTVISMFGFGKNILEVRHLRFGV